MTNLSIEEYFPKSQALTFVGTSVGDGSGKAVVVITRVVVAVVNCVVEAVETMVLVIVTVPAGGLPLSPPPLRPCSNFNLC
jgi:hypothetical protein